MKKNKKKKMILTSAKRRLEKMNYILTYVLQIKLIEKENLKKTTKSL